MGETIAVTQKLALLYDVKVITAPAIFITGRWVGKNLRICGVFMFTDDCLLVIAQEMIAFKQINRFIELIVGAVIFPCSFILVRF